MSQKTIKELGHTIRVLQQESIRYTLLFWKPEAERIIYSKSKDIKGIEKTLDALLEVAFNKEVLIVFKKLCSYYYKINQQATIEYVEFYREMWDNDEGN